MPRAPISSGRKLLLLLALGVAVIGGAWWWQRPPREPVYNGQRLSEWVMANDPNRASRHEFIEYLHRFGPATVSSLTHMLEHGRHPFVRHGPLPLDHAPDWLRRAFSEKWGGIAPSTVKNERSFAASALSVLGAEAAPAIPALARSMEGDDDTLIVYAGYALESIGPAAWPAIKDEIEHGKTRPRTELLGMMALHFGRTEAEALSGVETMMKVSHDPDPAVRKSAASAIGECRRLQGYGYPIILGRLIPALNRLLSDPTPNVRLAALSALGPFGTEAAPCIPRVLELADDADPKVRCEAAEVLGRVDKAEHRSESRLRMMLGDTDSRCRREARIALTAFGTSAKNQSVDRGVLPVR